MQHQTIYQIEGMTRWDSADSLAAQLTALPQVEHVKVDIVAGTAHVTSAVPPSHDEVRAVVTEAGCTLASSTPQTQDASVSLGIFVCGLAVALIAGFTLSKLISPGAAADAAPIVDPTAMSAHQHGRSTGLGGLAISGNGYTLVPAVTTFGGPGRHQLSFVIKDAGGQTATTFASVHTKPMHLILVRRDLTGYQHLHPLMSPGGVWTVTADFTQPGPWRAYADFTAISSSYAQAALTLGYDLMVAGDFQPSPLPMESSASIVDNQTISYQGVPAKGTTVPLLFHVVQGGSAVATLEPYLGAFGHLVVLREGDLGYLHVHPEPQLAGASAKFWLTAPSAGRYRMFFDYKTHGQVRTAEFTVIVP